jgi:hypothetical protein
MSTDELKQMNEWAQEFEDFHARFSHLFARSEPREVAPHLTVVRHTIEQ